MSHQSFAHVKNYPNVSLPEQFPQDISTSFSESLLSEKLSIDNKIGNKTNGAVKIVSDAADDETKNALISPIVDKNIDEKISDIDRKTPVTPGSIVSRRNNGDLIKIEGISENFTSKKNPKIEKISLSQPTLRRNGNYNMASASASVRIVNSANIVDKKVTKSAGVKPTQATDSQDVKIVDDLPVINLPEILKINSEIKQVPQISKNTIPQTELVNKLAIDISTNEVISSINHFSNNQRFSEKKIDDLNKGKSNPLSEKPNDVLILKTNFDEINNYPDDSSNDDSIKVNIKNNLQNGIVASPDDKQFDNLFYLGKNEHVVGSEANDKFFVQSGGDNVLFGGKGSDEFWIFNGEVPESANIIADFEVGNDIIGISGSSSLGINASTLDLLEVDGNTEIILENQTLAVVYDMTASDINSSIVFI
ncbi:MAG: hypothetical protein KI793_08360 [Rivularia sp. (in: Bacteria)]|nr:hypothetical protein [Rivularia sp. MS3]